MDKTYRITMLAADNDDDLGDGKGLELTFLVKAASPRSAKTLLPGLGIEVDPVSGLAWRLPVVAVTSIEDAVTSAARKFPYGVSVIGIDDVSRLALRVSDAAKKVERELVA
jgi:hypothetical protein